MKRKKKRRITIGEVILPAAKSYDNQEFIHSRDGRVIRLLAEYLFPKQQLEKQQVKKTIIFFGSARIHSHEQCKQGIDLIEKKLPNASEKDKIEFEDVLDRLNKTCKIANYYEEARELAYLIAKWSNSLPIRDRFHICTGGGPGIMEAANRGAHDAGVKSIGLNISLPFEQNPNQFMSSELNFEFHYFFMRKLWFVFLAKAMIVFPGGFGTLDELMEILTLRQTQKVTKPLPIFLYSRKFWEKLVNFEYMVDIGTISKKDLDLFRFVDSPKEAFEMIKSELCKIHNIDNGKKFK